MLRNHAICKRNTNLRNVIEENKNENKAHDDAVYYNCCF
jgi:hypothetical protein